MDAAHGEIAQNPIGLSLDAETQSSVAPVVVQGDVDALRTLVSNLVDNAVRYTPAGGRVDVAVAAEEARVTLSVRDSGPGIAICAQIVNSSQAAGPSVQSIDTPSRDRAITNRDVDVSVYQYTAERSADTEHGETAQVERDAVCIDPDPTFAALANDVIREAI